MIVFVAKDEAAVFNELEARLLSVNQRVCKLLQNSYNALVLAMQAISKHSGVFFLSERLARGFDLKFAVSAFVVVYAAEFAYMSGTIEQMIGRANRNQDVQAGRVFCTFSSLVDEYADWDFYIAQERLNLDDFGLRILRGLLLVWKDLA